MIPVAEISVRFALRASRQLQRSEAKIESGRMCFLLPPACVVESTTDRVKTVPINRTVLFKRKLKTFHHNGLSENKNT